MQEMVCFEGTFACNELYVHFSKYSLTIAYKLSITATRRQRDGNESRERAEKILNEEKCRFFAYVRKKQYLCSANGTTFKF